MPYISTERRHHLDDSIDAVLERIDALNDTSIGNDSPNIAGDLNYVITRILDGAYPNKRYRHMNEAIGVLECAKQEFYRRIAAPYEDQKMFDEGDAYGINMPQPAAEPTESVQSDIDHAAQFRAIFDGMFQSFGGFDEVVRNLDEVSQLAKNSAQDALSKFDQLKKR